MPIYKVHFIILIFNNIYSSNTTHMPFTLHYVQLPLFRLCTFIYSALHYIVQLSRLSTVHYFTLRYVQLFIYRLCTLILCIICNCLDSVHSFTMCNCLVFIHSFTLHYVQLSRLCSFIHSALRATV